MERREFLQYSGLVAGALALPVRGRHADLPAALTPIPDADKKDLADAALNAARAAGATYADVRIGRSLTQFVSAREHKIQGVGGGESYGAGVRVIAAGTWGFAATSVVTPDGIVGKVISAYPTASEVLLVTDPEFAAGVISSKSMSRGTLKGQGTPMCKVDYVPFEDKLEAGEKEM